jgi:DNA-binding MarR family transcriptional regulator
MKEAEKPDGAEVDRVVHEPARLGILTHLATSPGGRAGFTQIKEELGLSAGNLSVQLKNLEAAGYLSIEKSFKDSKPRTEALISPDGEAALAAYIDRMDSIISSLKKRIG